MKRTFTVKHDNPDRASICQRAIEYMREVFRTGQDFEIEMREPKRSLDANAAMWATLTDISKQLDWPHTEGGEWRIGKMSTPAWKAVLTAGFEQETQMAQGVGGGTVMVGASTSKFSKRRMGEFLEYAHAFGAERDVRFSERARDDLEFYAPAQRRAA